MEIPFDVLAFYEEPRHMLAFYDLGISSYGGTNHNDAEVQANVI